MTESPVVQPARLVSAAELRAHMAELEAEKQKLLEAKRSKAENAMQSFAEQFARSHLTEEEMAEMRRKIRHAVDNGLFEVMLLRFPSALCTDKGRAVNNALPNWPDTLPGKARDLYEAWDQWARPAGYHLRAYIIDFPGGMPGDVGMFVNWAE